MDGLCKCKTKLGSLTARVRVLSLGKPGSWHATFRGCSGKKYVITGCWSVAKTSTFSQLGPGGDRGNNGRPKDATVLTGEFRKRQNSAHHVTMGPDQKWV